MIIPAYVVLATVSAIVIGRIGTVLKSHMDEQRQVESSVDA